MTHTRLRYHINWTTKNRQPWITPRVERVIHGAIIREAEEMRGRIIAQNGWTEHHHVIAAFPSTISVSTAAARLKRASSAAVRKQLKLLDFKWQAGFWCETLNPRRMRGICRYVDRQKEHHGRGETRDDLEPI